MRLLIQRVTHASVSVAEEVCGQIGRGLLILVGVAGSDTEKEPRKLAHKAANLRIFSDQEGKFAHSLLDVGGGALVVSQFTLYGDVRKGRRPSFSTAARPQLAQPLVDFFVRCLREEGVGLVESGRFGAHMQVSLCNHGPVTLWMDSDQLAR